MTLSEFSDQFSTLLNSHSLRGNYGEQNSYQDIVLDEYEKSVYLSHAQEELVLSLYSGKNIEKESFEQTEELRRYLSSLVMDCKRTPIAPAPISGVTPTSKFFPLPHNLWFILYESVHTASNACGEASTMEVTPVTLDEYHRIERNPFRGTTNRRALRLDAGEDLIEIVSNNDIDSYYVRYLIKPVPIILEDLPDGLSIDGRTEETECRLHKALHRRILERAVIMALQDRGKISTNTQKQ